MPSSDEQAASLQQILFLKNTPQAAKTGEEMEASMQVGISRNITNHGSIRAHCPSVGWLVGWLGKSNKCWQAREKNRPPCLKG